MKIGEEIVRKLQEEGLYENGDVTFEVDGNGVRMVFHKKGDLPEELLTGIEQDMLVNANPKHISAKEVTNEQIEIVNDTKADMILQCKGCLESCVSDLLDVCSKVRSIYDKTASHVTRMFGSYVLITKKDGELKAQYSTPSPIKYCPLMFKLLREIGGDSADQLLDSLKNGNQEEYQKSMLALINDVVISGGGFDDNRPLNSCERNVTFGASEIMSDAMKKGKLDAAVIVSNNLGTVITTRSDTTQGVVKRMSGLFYTTASPELIEQAYREGIVSVFPFTGRIDQTEGVKQAIKMGYKNISVSVAARDNKYLKELSALEKDGVKIYRFALCATGVDNKTAEMMANNADIVWSCASKPVREVVAPNAKVQVGVKIPVYLMTEQGWDLVKPRLNEIDKSFDLETVVLKKGDDMPIIYNQNNKLNIMKKSELDNTCIDCPDPCV